MDSHVLLPTIGMHKTKEKLAVYFAALPALLPDHQGKFALICDDQVSVHETAEAAWESVMHKCPDTHDFVIMRIEPCPANIKYGGGSPGTANRVSKNAKNAYTIA